MTNVPDELSDIDDRTRTEIAKSRRLGGDAQIAAEAIELTHPAGWTKNRRMKSSLVQRTGDDNSQPAPTREGKRGLTLGAIRGGGARTGDADKAVLTAIFDKPSSGSISLSQRHEDERRRTKRFAEQTARFRKAMNDNPELAAGVEPQRLPDGRFEIKVDEQTRRELNEIAGSI